MSDPLFKELDLERCARMLRRMAPACEAVAVCDASGEVVWSGERARDAQLRRLLADLGDGAELLGAAQQRAELDAELTLWCQPIRPGGGLPAGWLLALATRDAEASPELGDALEDAAAALAGEYGLQREIGSLVEELSGRYEELNLVYTFEGQTRAFDSGTLGARALLENFAKHLSVDVAALVLPDRRDPIYALGDGERIQNLDLVLTQMRGDLFRFVCASRRPFVLNEPEDPRREYLFVNMPYRILACPVTVAQGTYAMLALMRRPERREFTNGDRNLAKVIAGQTAIIMRNQTMVDRHHRFSEQMASALIAAIEAKDPYTRGHSERVQALSVEIGRGANLSAQDLESVSWGALLHDVGKIGIPDAILCKPGRLTEDEYTLIQVHPERSYEILAHIEYLGRDAIEAARYHQEKFDGTGYPHGLQGNQIPLHARVVAVADTYDAITSSRAYRPGQSHEVALDVIARVAGSQLDPQYVRVFERLCENDAATLARITGLRESEDA